MAFDNVEVDEYIVLTVPGCTDPSATNYNLNATIKENILKNFTYKST